MSDVMYSTNDEATPFVKTVSLIYKSNEAYAPGLSGLEKSMAEIKPLSGGLEITVFAGLRTPNEKKSPNIKKK